MLQWELPLSAVWTRERGTGNILICVQDTGNIHICVYDQVAAFYVEPAASMAFAVITHVAGK